MGQCEGSGQCFDADSGSTSAQSDQVKRRMMVMMKERAGEPELPLDEPDHDPETGEVRSS